MRSITVVGASLAGLSTVRALRAEGYRREGAPVAVLSLNQPKLFGRIRRTLGPAAAVVAP